jgi:hypothetical protein
LIFINKFLAFLLRRRAQKQSQAYAMDTSAVSSTSLPPLPQHGARAPAVTNEDFRALMASQGLQAPASGTPTEAEARIAAAQIAAKANVRTAVKHGRVLAGMDTTPAATVAPAAPGRFMPLRQGPAAARAFTAPGSPGATASTVESLRATSKFSTGPVADPNRPQAAAAIARTQKIAMEKAAAAAAHSAPVRVPAPKAIEAYTYGLRAAGQTRDAELPAWFDDAVQNGIDKYAAMKTPR